MGSQNYVFIRYPHKLEISSPFPLPDFSQACLFSGEISFFHERRNGFFLIPEGIAAFTEIKTD
jgi:hypothetical protein